MNIAPLRCSACDGRGELLLIREKVATIALTQSPPLGISCGSRYVYIVSLNPIPLMLMFTAGALMSATMLTKPFTLVASNFTSAGIVGTGPSAVPL